MASPVPARPALPMLANGVTFLSEEAHFSPVHPAGLVGNHSKCPRPAAPNLFGPRDRFRGRRLLHGRAGDSSGGNGSAGSGGHAGDGGRRRSFACLPAAHVPNRLQTHSTASQERRALPPPGASEGAPRESSPFTSG